MDQINMNISNYFTTLPEARKHNEPSDFRSAVQFALKAASELKEKEVQMIEALQKVDKIKAYRNVGCNSLFIFATKSLKLSGHQAYQYISVARKSLFVPELKTALESKEITISKAHRISPVITEKNQSFWIEKAKTLPKSELERQIAKENPKTRQMETSKYINDFELELSLTISDKNFKQLEQIKSILSQGNKQMPTLDEVIGAISEFYLERKDPVRKAERGIKRAAKKAESYSGTANKKTKRSPIPIKTLHQLRLRDRGQCQYLNCNENKWLEIHHKQPISLGGGHQLENLETLCSVHHKMIHEELSLLGLV